VAGFDAARSIVLTGIDKRIFPAAVAEVGDSGGVLWREAFGTLTFDESSRRADESTVFDLASLTKPISTTSVILDLDANAALDIHEPVAAFFTDWRGGDRVNVTVQDLLEHASGLAARLVDSPPEGRREFEHEICTIALEYEPRTRSVYSDLGFILLGFLASDRGRAPLAVLFERIRSKVLSELRVNPDATNVLQFGVSAPMRDHTAPTLPLEEDLRRRRTLIGEVHDNYAALLGGTAGHAGLFGTAAGVGLFARAALAGARGERSIPVPLSPALMGRATQKTSVPGSSRALGWDTMLPASSCGTKLSAAAFGHTGFTGTSLWIDPVLDRYFVLLTNRVCGGGNQDQIREVRRAFHDALAG
jgi:CubicO group peptidase (beta-lactamase class C family)